MMSDARQLERPIIYVVTPWAAQRWEADADWRNGVVHERKPVDRAAHETEGAPYCRLAVGVVSRVTSGDP